MEVIKYNSDAHGKTLGAILSERTLSDDWKQGLPEHSYFVQANDEMVAFMCMRRIEGGMAILETAVTNPKCAKQLRHEAMDILSAFLVNQAQRLDLIGILFVTEDKNTILRGVSHGGQILNKVVVSRYFK